jgi:hypothetical protein
MYYVLMVCMSFHNMVVEDEHEKTLEPFELIKDIKIK